jgi:hypothetical protein
MTLQALIDHVADLLSYDLDNFQADSSIAVTSADSIEQVNWAYRLFCTRLYMHETSVTFTIVEDQEEYDLFDLTTPVVSKRVIKPLSVYVNGVTLKDLNGRPGVWSFPEFEENFRSWRSYDAATPTKAVILPNNKMLLSPKPDATAAAYTCYISGQVLPADLASGDLATEIPLDPRLHEALAHMVAYKVATPTATEEDSWRRLREFKSDSMNVLETLSKENKRRMYPQNKRQRYRETVRI